MPELLPCQGALKDTGCVCVCWPGTERSVCPRGFGAKGDEVPAGIVFEGVVAGGKIGVKFEKSGEWRARRDWGVLLSGFYFDFFFILSPSPLSVAVAQPRSLPSTSANPGLTFCVGVWTSSSMAWGWSWDAPEMGTSHFPSD